MKVNKLVWVIDDDEAILEVFSIILEEAGYKNEVIRDGRLVENKLKKEQPGLIFLDLLMSGVDGREISQMIKNNPSTQDIPIIITSADTNIEQKTGQAKADGYLKKPFNIDDVNRLVKKYIK